MLGSSWSRDAQCSRQQQSSTLTGQSGQEPNGGVISCQTGEETSTYAEVNGIWQ